MKTFYKLLGLALVVATLNNFVWFALTYWAYLSTNSVVTTSVMAGVFLLITALSGFWLGSIVDHHKKKAAMLGSSLFSLAFFLIGFLILYFTPASFFATVSSPMLWVLIVVLLLGTLAGSIYNICIPTLVPILVEEEHRDKANGLFGTTIGIAFAVTSVASGIVLAFFGMKVVLLVAVIGTLLAIIFLYSFLIPEKKVVHEPQVILPHTVKNVEDGIVEVHHKGHKKVDIKGTIRAVRAVPGLFALIFFSTFNNFLGGVFFALMDAYGLSLVEVEVWGILWGLLSFSFIFGGLYIAKKGLGKDPLKILFRNNIITWIVCIFFTIQPSIVLLCIGTFIWMFFAPFTEAIEQTIFQKVVPPERLGRVFGFAQSMEQAASPLTAFLIGPIAQWFFIPFMTTGEGVNLIGDWFGTGTGRGIALVFILAGIIGLIVTLIARRSKVYRLLAERYQKG